MTPTDILREIVAACAELMGELERLVPSGAASQSQYLAAKLDWLRARLELAREVKE